MILAAVPTTVSDTKRVPRFPIYLLQSRHWYFDHKNLAFKSTIETPLWVDCEAQTGNRAQIEPDWDLVAQPVPDYEVDQRSSW